MGWQRKVTEDNLRAGLTVKALAQNEQFVYFSRSSLSDGALFIQQIVQDSGTAGWLASKRRPLA